MEAMLKGTSVHYIISVAYFIFLLPFISLYYNYFKQVGKYWVIWLGPEYYDYIGLQIQLQLLRFLLTTVSIMSNSKIPPESQHSLLEIHSTDK